jgi:predicted nucleic acid-binding protein
VRFVIDASVATKWAVIEEQRQPALNLLKEGHDLIAPSILLGEVANALWKKHRLGEINRKQAAAGLAAVKAAMGSLEEVPRLAEAALRIGMELDHPDYDCFYIACAVATAAPLITADRRLLGAVVGSPYEPMVIRLPADQ